MKYAFFIFSFFIFGQSVLAAPVTSFKDSDALITIAQFMNDVKEDLPNAFTISDKKIVIKDTSSCVLVSAEDVFNETHKAIKKVLRFYPDEELPVDEALADLESYIGIKSFNRCLFEKTTNEHIIRTIYFFDNKDKIHLRVDNWTLLVAGQ